MYLPLVVVAKEKVLLPGICPSSTFSHSRRKKGVEHFRIEVWASVMAIDVLTITFHALTNTSPGAPNQV
jgi:hypothetical protein